VLLGSTFAIAWVPAFAPLLALRVVEGMAVPAILTALMTQISRATPPERMGRTMGFYIAATIVGGFLGRAATGVVSSLFDWRASFLFLSAGVLLCLALHARRRGDVTLTLARPTLADIGRTLHDRYYLLAYAAIFCVFFVFMAALNFLPFRMVELDPSVSGAGIGLMYSGYLVGVAVALAAPRIAQRAGGEPAMVLAGIALFGLSTALWAVGGIAAMYLNMLLFCAGMFTVHSLLSGMLNARAREHKGVVNGLYVAAYYAGGTLGSVLPGLVYRAQGWQAFVAVLTAMAALAFVLALTLRSRQG
jgi:YNFM family putative membrane transporter